MRFRKRLFEIVEKARPGDVASRIFDVSIMTLICLNLLAIILASVERLWLTYWEVFFWFELFSVAVFTAEYVVRVWSCVEERAFRRPVAGRARFALTPLAIVDLLAILPFYLPFLGVDLRALRVLRLFRLFRIFKMARYSNAMRLLWRVVVARRAELLITLFTMGILLVLASTTMYFAESEAQPAAFPHIPAAMWWAVATLTTVGYGDVYPITALGKLMGSVVAILGIGMFALPTGVLGAGFVAEIQKRKRPRKTCPHCGKEIEGTGGMIPTQPNEVT